MHAVATSFAARVMGVMSCVIAVMARYPFGDGVKTRLSQRLEASARAELYDAFLRDTLDHVREVSCVMRALVFTPPSEHEFFRALAGQDMAVLPQRGEDLGARIYAALDDLFREHARVLLLGSDSPDVPTAYLDRAARALERGAELVIGPSDDGGFYCLGLCRPAPGLFDGVQWSTDRTCAQTLQRAAALELEATLLPSWYDVDHPEDLDRLERNLAHGISIATHTSAVLEAMPARQPA